MGLAQYMITKSQTGGQCCTMANQRTIMQRRKLHLRRLLQRRPSLSRKATKYM
jgi:hypothetical protein